MDNKKKGIGIFIVAILVISVFTAMPVIAQPSDKGGVHGSGPTTSLTNGDLVLDVEADGEYNNVYLNGGTFEIDGSSFVEEPIFYVDGSAVGSSNWVIVSSTSNRVTTTFDLGTDISVAMVATVMPNNILKREYTFTNTGLVSHTLVVTEYVDGDIVDSSDDFGAYNPTCQVIWQFDQEVSPPRLLAFTGTSSGFGLVGFEVNELGAVDHTPGGLNNIVVNDGDGDGVSDFPYSDAETDLQWDMGTVNPGQDATLTVESLFATGIFPTALCPTQVPTLTPIGLIALVGLLSVIAAMSIKIRKKRE